MNSEKLFQDCLLFSATNLTDDSGDDFSPSSLPVAAGQGGGSQSSEVQSALRTLGSKVEDLSTCNDLISKHGSALQRSESHKQQHLHTFLYFHQTKQWLIIDAAYFLFQCPVQWKIMIFKICSSSQNHLPCISCFYILTFQVFIRTGQSASNWRGQW